MTRRQESREATEGGGLNEKVGVSREGSGLTFSTDLDLRGDWRLMQEIARSPENRSPFPLPRTPTIQFTAHSTPSMYSEYSLKSSYLSSPVSLLGCPSQTNCPWQSHPKWPPSTPPTETKSPWFMSLYCNSGETQCRWLIRSRDHRRNQRFRKCHSQ